MFDHYYELYLKNMVALSTLEKLVKARMLTQEDVDKMVFDRLEQHGF